MHIYITLSKKVIRSLKFKTDELSRDSPPDIGRVTRLDSGSKVTNEVKLQITSE